MTPPLPAVPGGWKQETVTVPAPGGERRFLLWTPADPDAVLESCEPGSDPYWATLWPVGATLAARVLADPPAEATRVLELGCGAGLAGLAAASAGCAATVTDREPRAVALAAANAAANGLNVTAAVLDWDAPPALSPERRFDLVLGADLLYQPDLHGALLATLAAVTAPGGAAWLADPGRAAAARFLHAADAAGWRVLLEAPDGAPLLSPRVAGHQLVRLTRRS